MSSIPTDETPIRTAFAPARSLEPADAEIAAILRRAAARERRFQTRGQAPRRLPLVRSRALALAAVAIVVCLAGGYAAAPPLRAAIDDLTGTFGDWAGGDSGDAPGRALGADEQAPSYFHDRRFARNPRVIAEADGYKLYAAREPGGDTMQFDLGDTGVGLGGISAESFRDRMLLVLGPGSVQNADEKGYVPLFGVTARSVASVELTYATGPSLRLDGVDGGFVLLAEPDRAPREIIARDSAGREVARTRVDNSSHDGPRIDWSQYGPPAPRVPSRCLPGVAGREPGPGCPAS